MNMPISNLNDLFFAYALGCLNNDDKTELNKLIEKGVEYSWRELGNLQNLAAFLPIVLDIENPGIEIKDKVADKLSHIREEFRTGVDIQLPEPEDSIVSDETKKTIEPDKQKEEQVVNEVIKGPDEFPDEIPINDFSGETELQNEISEAEEIGTPDIYNIETEIPEENKKVKDEVLELNDEPALKEEVQENAEEIKTVDESEILAEEPETSEELPAPPPGFDFIDELNDGVIDEETLKIKEPEKFSFEDVKDSEDSFISKMPQIKQDEKSDRKSELSDDDKKNKIYQEPVLTPIHPHEEKFSKVEPKDLFEEMPDAVKLNKEENVSGRVNQPAAEIGKTEPRGIFKQHDFNLPPPEIKKMAENKDEGAKQNISDKGTVFNQALSASLHPMPKKRGYLIPLLIVLLLLSSGLVYLYFNFSSKIEKYQSHLEYLNKKIDELNDQVTHNSDIQSILESSNVKIVNLKTTPNHEQGFGKLILSLNDAKGYIQLSNMPKLENNKAFQLWMITGGKVISLGVFGESGSTSYYPFTLPVINDQNNLNFVVTIEPSTGSQSPSRTVYLTGSIQQ